MSIRSGYRSKAAKLNFDPLCPEWIVLEAVISSPACAIAGFGSKKTVCKIAKSPRLHSVQYSAMIWCNIHIKPVVCMIYAPAQMPPRNWLASEGMQLPPETNPIGGVWHLQFPCFQSLAIRTLCTRTLQWITIQAHNRQRPNILRMYPKNNISSWFQRTILS